MTLNLQRLVKRPLVTEWCLDEEDDGDRRLGGGDGLRPLGDAGGLLRGEDDHLALRQHYQIVWTGADASGGNDIRLNICITNITIVYIDILFIS